MIMIIIINIPVRSLEHFYFKVSDCGGKVDKTPMKINSCSPKTKTIITNIKLEHGMLVSYLYFLSTDRFDR